jgi:hypothetical protein
MNAFCRLKLFRRGRWMAAITGTLLVLLADKAHACACCSDPGEYRLTTDEPSDYQLGQIQMLQFAATAQRYVTDADDEDTTGLVATLPEYGLLATVEPKRWRLAFRTADGKTGVLTLPLPSKITTLAADIRDGEKSGGGGPLLYKEWRFEGTATGEGIFQEASTHYTLIFQGRGNRCDNAEDFKHWRLELSGKKTACAFFGELVTANP